MKYNIKGRKRIRDRYNERIKPRFQKPIPRTVVPSFFTLMNLFCGFLSIVQVSEGNLMYGAWLIAFAGFFDAMDGFMARITNSNSAFGIELDSLSDIVSFGVAPGFLLYTFSLNGMQTPGIILSAFPALCGAVRLARFNVDAQINQTPYFKGLPIPVQAIMFVGFYLTFRNNTEFFDHFDYGINAVLIPLILILSILMVSTVPFDKTPLIKKGLPVQKKRLFLFLIYAVLIVALQEWGLILVFSFYILKGLTTAIIKFWREFMSDDVIEASDSNIPVN